MSAPSASPIPEPRFQPQSWNRNPVQRIRRHLKQTNSFDDDIKGHVTLWLDDLTEHMGNDPRQRAMLSIAGSVYTECVRAQADLLQHKPGTKAHERAGASLLRNSAALSKLMRLAGLNRPANGHTPGNVFTAPRVNAGNGQPREEAAEENGVPASDE